MSAAIITKQYESYKDSGNEWLGEIPSSWNVRRIKDIAATTSGTTPASGNRFYYENGEFNWIRTTDLNNGKLFETEHKLTPLALQECRLQFLPIDTVLVAMYGGFGTIGKNAILKQASTINQSICAVLPNPRKFDSLYLQYFLHYFRDAWQLFADGARKDPNINQDAVKNLFVIQPPIAEQVFLAQYLDRHTAAIDRKIDLLEQKTKLYQTLRKTLINETVCRGLDPEAPRKDSGIEWIGEIPAHWEVKRFKSFAYPVKGKVAEGFDEQKPGTLPVLSLDYLRNEISSTTTYLTPTNKINVVTPDDYIIIWDGAGVGEMLKGKAGILSSTIAKLVFDKKIMHSHFCYFLRGAIEHTTKGIPAGMGIPHLNPVVLNTFLCPCPPLEEQVQITGFLREKTKKMDTITANLKAQIATLKELRKTLINDVVTGKINVTA